MAKSKQQEAPQSSEQNENLLAELDQRIADLNAQRAEIIAAKRKEALVEARKLVSTFAFTASELGIGAAAVAERAKRAPVKPKYRNPADASATWSGRGQKPVWVKELLAKGGKLEDVAI